MLKIHKLHSKKLSIISITFILSICTLLGISYLTYTPNLSHAETVIYKPDTHPNLSDISIMQDMTSEICQNTTIGYAKTLIDNRDNNSYTVTKFNDNNCWMTQNLRLVGPRQLSSANSNVSSYTMPANSNSFSNRTEDEVAYYAGDPVVGAKYSWCAATAHTCWETYYGSSQASGSICPKGWILPDYSQYGDFLNIEKPTYEQSLLPPYNFTPDVSYLYWTRSATNFDRPMLVWHSGSNLRIGQDAGYVGISIRCMTQGGIKGDANNVDITIAKSILLDISPEITVEKGKTNPSTTNLNVKVGSNQKYSIGISAKSPSLTSPASSTTIPSKSGLLNTNDNAWGIKKLDTAKAPASSFTSITSANQTFYTSSTPESTTLLFPIGISTTPDLPSGEYSTNITVTATQN